jgi:hypothetical protein
MRRTYELFGFFFVSKLHIRAQSLIIYLLSYTSFLQGAFFGLSFLRLFAPIYPRDWSLVQSHCFQNYARLYAK